MRENRRIKKLVAMLMAFIMMLTSSPITAIAASQLSRPTSLKVDLKNQKFTWSKVSRAEGYTVRLYEREKGEKDPGPDEYLTSKYTDTNSISMERFNDVLKEGEYYFFRVFAISDNSRYEDSEISGCSGDFCYTEDYDDGYYGPDDDDDFDGWERIDGYWYYYRNGRLIKEQWLNLKEDGKWYWYYVDRKGRRLSSRWYEEDEKVYYFGSNGRMATDTWIPQDFQRYYVGSDGVLYQNTEAKIGNKWYSFDSEGRATQIPEQNHSYQTKPNNGNKLSGFVKGTDGSWYFYENGVMVRNDWRYQLDSAGAKYWYCFGTDGRMKTSTWEKSSGEWYYLGSNGLMATSTWIGGKYYVNQDGVMFHDCQREIGGVLYYFNSSGVANRILDVSIPTGSDTPGCWQQIGNGWAFVYPNGNIAGPGTWISWKGYSAYIDADYRAVQNRYADIGGLRCYFDNDCYLRNVEKIR